MSTENIYPGIDAKTNKTASETPENFIKKFGKLISYARTNDIEIHINDVNNRHILPKRDLENRLNNLETESLKVFYLNLQNQKLQVVREDICENMQKHMFALYAGEIIPAELTKRFALSQNEKQAVKEHNQNIIQYKKPANKQGTIMNVDDLKYQKYIKHLMKDRFSSHGVNIDVADTEIIRNRLRELGEEVNSINFIQQRKKEIEDKQHTYKSAIQILNKFFTEIIITNSPAIKECVENHEFSKAWHNLLTEQLVTNDTDMTIISLNQNILNLTFDTNQDNDFDIFYNRFTVTHALYLFKLWHETVTYETILYIISQFNDEDGLEYVNKNLSQEKQIQRIPDQVNYEQRFIQLRRAITGSHLQQTLQNYLSTSQIHHLNGLVNDLKQVDKTCTIRYSSTTATQIQNQSIGAPSTPSLKTKTNSTITTTTTKEESQPTKFQRLMQQMPADFNHDKHCVSCYASGESTGKYKDIRGRLYKTHTSHDCLWKQLKTKNMNTQDIEDRYRQKYDKSYQPKSHPSDQHYYYNRSKHPDHKFSDYKYTDHKYPDHRYSDRVPSSYNYHDQPQGNHVSLNNTSTHSPNYTDRAPSPTNSTHSKRTYRSEPDHRDQFPNKSSRHDNYNSNRNWSRSSSPNYDDSRDNRRYNS